MFCMNADISPTAVAMTASRRFSLAPAIRVIHCVTRFMAPERSRPYPRIMTPIMAMTALLAKPEKISCGGTSRSQASSSMTRMATRSTRTTSRMKRTMVKASTRITSMMSVDMK